MKKYENYKSSGIEWIGEVPKHWEVKKIGLLFKKIGSGATPKSDNESYYKDGDINWLNTGDLDNAIILSTSKKITKKAFDEYSTLKIYPKGSIVIAMYGATIGKLGILEIETTTNQACCVLAENIQTETMFVFNSLSAGLPEILNLSNGGGQPNISQETIKSFKICVPPLEEQTAIANFLDAKTTAIDQSIADKENLINLLEEEKKALINEAVTKGVNPNIKLKNSGIDWLGEIPEHWEVKKLRYVASCNDEVLSELTEPDTLINYIEIGDVTLKNGIEDFKEISFKEAPSRARRITKKGDIIVSTVRTYLGAITRIENDNYIVSTGFAVLRSKNTESEFLGFYVKSKGFIDQVISLSAGVSYPSITSSQLLQIEITVPPIEEQTQIVNYIETESEKISTKVNLIKEEIALLKEYRSALIFEAVTGKIDVRGFDFSYR